ncbi:MAG: hypothetical protein LPK19_07480, partial [Hymenobacteraceae bacterium]|nr:hypothetical protein [Hymenobacteraceae bacterium]MDX5396052.1 hypothetical protein [Hymenobacteraceae bacterium]MDX5512113.1 hypothetical protein [Hymenobacteraceae bacterium]
MRFVLLLLFMLVSGPWLHAVQAQFNVPLRYVKDLPKELFSAPTAALLSYVTNSTDTAVANAGYRQLQQKLKQYNSKLGLNLVAIADNENTDKQWLYQQLSQKGVQQLLFISEVEIVAHGAQDTYR